MQKMLFSLSKTNQNAILGKKIFLKVWHAEKFSIQKLTCCKISKWKSCFEKSSENAKIVVFME